jgi:hypothetical protein
MYFRSAFADWAIVDWGQGFPPQFVLAVDEQWKKMELVAVARFFDFVSRLDIKKVEGGVSGPARFPDRHQMKWLGLGVDRWNEWLVKGEDVEGGGKTDEFTLQLRCR